jgi:cytidine deaminase
VREVGNDGGVQHFHRRRRGIHIEFNDVDLHVLAEQLALQAALRDGHDGGVRAALAFRALRCDGCE